MTVAKSRPMKTLSLKLTPTLSRELEALALRRGMSKSCLVREALARYLFSGSRVSRGSFLERARELAGCVEGPSDLSVNAEHLQGYGR
ncbi:MAG TPA: ribbon-helix-helix protein, CopG family [Thermoanaerobaculia bacterium]|jgi:predicted transcriptional regulator|nr:ribbon-helix-helix protein, CopG family [Thermoanaerobaculia bacterium]